MISKIALLLCEFRPHFCGVSDYCVSMADDLNNSGNEAVLVEVSECFDFFMVYEVKDGSAFFREKIESKEFLKNFDYLYIQYTPFMFSKGWIRRRFHISLLALTCSRTNVRVIINVHEGYNFEYKLSLRLILALLINIEIFTLIIFSSMVFTASEVFLKNSRILYCKKNLKWLPISSNFPDPNKFIDTNYASNNIVNGICIFGGGNNLRGAFQHVLELQNYLTGQGIPFRWLILGKVDDDLLRLFYEPIVFGPLSDADISAVLSSARVFVMPNVDGVSLKRGTLMAAMQHSLAVVGTEGKMTDPSLRKFKGVKLFQVSDYTSFCESVKGLLLDQSLSKSLGASNREDYGRYFSRSVRFELFLAHLRGLK